MKKFVVGFVLVTFFAQMAHAKLLLKTDSRGVPHCLDELGVEIELWNCMEPKDVHGGEALVNPTGVGGKVVMPIGAPKMKLNSLAR